MSTERKYSQFIIMPCTVDQFIKDLDQFLKDVPYPLEAHIPQMKYLYFKQGMVMWDEELRDAWNQYIHIPNYNPELFLAIASMSYGEEFYPGEWVVSLNSSIASFKKGKIYQVGDTGKQFGLMETDVCIRNDDRGMSDNAWHHQNFRKATVEELIQHFSKEDGITDVVFKEPKEESKYIPRFNDRVIAYTKNSTTPFYGSYMEESGLGSWHYVQQEGTGNIFECVKVQLVEMVDVSIDHLIQMYAEVHKVHPLTVRVTWPKKDKI